MPSQFSAISHARVVDVQPGDRSAHLDVWQTSMVNPDFADFARSCGADAHRVQRRDDLDTAIVAALAHTGPSLVHVTADVVLV